MLAVLQMVYCNRLKGKLSLGLNMLQGVSNGGRITSSVHNLLILFIIETLEFFGPESGKSQNYQKYVSSVVDGVCGDDNIAELWASQLKCLLNSNSGDLSLTVHSKISSTGLSELSVSDLDVCEALQRLKGGKKETDNLSSDHLHHAAPVIAAPLATLFTAILRHGYMPNSFRNCTVVPIPKGPKDVTCSSNYRGIAIASTISKVLEHVIYSAFLASSDYQFGFKSSFSTTLCLQYLDICIEILMCMVVSWMPQRHLI